MRDARKKALEDWVTEASKTDRGALLLANLAHELASNSIPASVMNRLVQAIADCWLASGGMSPVDVFRTALRSVGDEAFCKGQPPLQSPQRCSRIMTAPDFFRHHVNLNFAGLLPEFDVPTHAIQRLEQEGLSKLAKGQLTSGQPVVWVTESDAIESVRRTSSRPPGDSTKRSDNELASSVRERLGLNHYGEDQHLLELVYPPSVTAMGFLHPPTVLDGMRSVYYRSKRTDQGWGITVDLASGEDGLPEAVHPPLPLTEEFAVRDLGRIRRNVTRVDYQSLAQTAPNPWCRQSMESLYACLEAMSDESN